MNRFCKTVSLATVVFMLFFGAGFAQTITNNNANTQPAQQQQGFGGWAGWMPFLPFPLPPLPLPFFGLFGGRGAQGAAQGANNNQNVVVNTGGAQENNQMMELMKRVIDLLEKRENEGGESGASEGAQEGVSGSAVSDSNENSSQTGEGALNE